MKKVMVQMLYKSIVQMCGALILPLCLLTLLSLRGGNLVRRRGLIYSLAEVNKITYSTFN